jgi:hypothetical protein
MKKILLAVLICLCGSNFAFAENADVSGAWFQTSVNTVTAQVEEKTVSHYWDSYISGGRVVRWFNNETTYEYHTDEEEIFFCFSNVLQTPDGTISATENSPFYTTKTLTGRVVGNNISFSMTSTSHLDIIDSTTEISENCSGTIVPSLGTINCTCSGTYRYTYTYLGSMCDYYTTKTATFTLPVVISYVNKVSLFDTYIFSGPEGTTTSKTADFSYIGVSSKGIVGYYYQLDSNPEVYTTETSVSFEDLAYGPHTFSVAAKDEDDNIDPTPAVWSFTVGESPSPESPNPPLMLRVGNPKIRPSATL